jgi:thiol-disulfide isomerase/thioredoxin
MNQTTQAPQKLNTAPHRPLLRVAAALLMVAVAFLVDRTPARAANSVQAVTIKQFERVIQSPDYTGLVIAIASWCNPCKKELPEVARLYDTYNGKGIRIVAMGLDVDSSKNIQSLVDRLKIPFPVYWVGNAGITHYKIFGVPTTMVVRKGEMIEKLPGQMSRGHLEDRIRSLLVN